MGDYKKWAMQEMVSLREMAVGEVLFLFLLATTAPLRCAVERCFVSQGEYLSLLPLPSAGKSPHAEDQKDGLFRPLVERWYLRRP